MMLDNPEREAYLSSSEFIDWHDPEISKLAQKLAQGQTSDEAIAKNCFEWVRDEIKHSWDYKQNPVTCKASDVLKYATGYCFAKSHLLAALLRANNIPSGLCYQRLSIHDDGAPYSLHGFNAAYLKNFGWYRFDARGNKQNVDAQFLPPQEKLAFSINEENEKDFTDILAEPHLSVIEVLTTYQTVAEVLENLPDALEI